MFRRATLCAAYLLDAVQVRHRRWVRAGRAFAARLHGKHPAPNLYASPSRFGNWVAAILDQTAPANRCARVPINKSNHTACTHARVTHASPRRGHFHIPPARRLSFFIDAFLSCGLSKCPACGEAIRVCGRLCVASQRMANRRSVNGRALHRHLGRACY